MKTAATSIGQCAKTNGPRRRIFSDGSSKITTPGKNARNRHSTSFQSG